MKKFYKPGSTGASFNLRSAIIGFVVGMSAFSVSAEMDVPAMKTSIYDNDGSAHGKMTVTPTSAALVYDDQSWLEANSIVYKALMRRVEARENRSEIISRARRTRQENQGAHITFPNRNDRAELDYSRQANSDRACGYRFLTDLCREDMSWESRTVTENYGGYEAPTRYEIEAMQINPETTGFAF